MSSALGDAAWMTGMERNSDLVIMSCYAPLFVNVNPGAMQWKTDLIGYDAMTSYGSPAYYAQQMFSTHHGDDVLATEATRVPLREWQPPTPAARPGNPPPAAPAPKQVPLIFFDATRDSKLGTIYLKVVNRAGTPQKMQIAIRGTANVDPIGQLTVMAASDPNDTNSITEPKKLVPVTSKAEGLGDSFTRDFPAHSISVLEIKSQ
jgi:alpha-N-arabinofuranosidase